MTETGLTGLELRCTPPMGAGGGAAWYTHGTPVVVGERAARAHSLFALGARSFYVQDPSIDAPPPNDRILGGPNVPIRPLAETVLSSHPQLMPGYRPIALEPCGHVKLPCWAPDTFVKPRTIEQISGAAGRFRDVAPIKAGLKARPTSDPFEYYVRNICQSNDAVVAAGGSVATVNALSHGHTKYRLPPATIGHGVQQAPMVSTSVVRPSGTSDRWSYGTPQASHAIRPSDDLTVHQAYHTQNSRLSESYCAPEVELAYA